MGKMMGISAKKRARSQGGQSNIVKQLTMILTIISVFVMMALSFGAKNVDFSEVPILLIQITLLLWTVCCRYHSIHGEDVLGALKGLWKHRAFAAVLILAMVSRAFMGAEFQRWDGSQYFKALVDAAADFSFSFDYIWNTLRLVGHPTLGYSFMMIMGEFLTPGHLEGMYLVLIVLTGAALYCIYNMFRTYWCTTSCTRAAFYTFLISVIPLFWGAYSYINPDYMSIIFFVFMVYEESKKRYLTMIWWLLFLFQTKETAMLVVVGYLVGKSLYYLFAGKRTIKGNLMYAYSHPLMWVTTVCGIAGLYVVLFHSELLLGWGGIKNIGDLFGEGDADIIGGVSGAGPFAYIPEYFIHQLKLTFVVNFMWIFTAGIIQVFVWNLFYQIKTFWQNRKMPGAQKKVSRPAENDHWTEHVAGICGGSIMMTILLLFFITVPLNRYHYFTAVTIPILGIILYENLFRTKIRVSRLVELLMGAVLGGLLIGQTFRAIDPVSLWLFDSETTGKMTIMATGGEFEPYFDDTTVNNYQYTWQDQVMEQMLAETGYDEDTILIGDRMNLKISNLVWDPEEKDLSTVDERYMEEDQIEVKTTSLRVYQRKDASGGIADSRIANYSKAKLFVAPTDARTEKESLAIVTGYFDVVERKVISGKRGDFVCYLLEHNE